MKSWSKLPLEFRTYEVEKYYIILKKKVFYRFVKRLFDLSFSFILIVLLTLPMLIISFIVFVTSKGGSFFCQKRIGRYGKPFKIIKFRTMTINSETKSHVTIKDDPRVTRVGRFLRKTHLDELPQLFNVFVGQMSFVGTRPEVCFYYEKYEKTWFATLLMRPGITSTASLKFRDESKLISDVGTDDAYSKQILPEKMQYNLEDVSKANIWREIKIMFLTFLLIFK